ncbi:hypothetical protein [Flavivirga sp. 57AJ16]|uniref:hypothetical protein n=1 Tax=Flavivirga sp. 57AJ16 TaxID=3025307 RepID=UPI0023658CB8|nr:hypothetical protein [Flavivirga sp. 57AJ16]MDD7885427.1 hypothetical protein [Flavivirga sp. 57AJ16]
MMLNKSIPKYLKHEAEIALSFYPELKEVPIEFKLTRKMSSSVMKAQPKLGSLFKKRNKRNYVILISRHFDIQNRKFHTRSIPQNVLIGWLGHELGHVMDYQNRSGLNLIRFGLCYLFSESFVIKAEQTADHYAIRHHMKDYILETKNYILSHTGLSDRYKEKIKRLYTSPEQVLEFVNEKMN